MPAKIQPMIIAFLSSYLYRAVCPCGSSCFVVTLLYHQKTVLSRGVSVKIQKYYKIFRADERRRFYARPVPGADGCTADFVLPFHRFAPSLLSRPQDVHFILLIFLLYRFYRSHVIDKYTRSSLLLKKHKKGAAEATPKESCSVLCIILHFTVQQEYCQLLTKFASCFSPSVL